MKVFRLNTCVNLHMAMVLAWVVPSQAQFSYPNCPDLTSTDFRTMEHARGKGLTEPVGFDLQGIYNAAGDSVTQVNMIFVERVTGNIKFYNGATQVVNTAGNIPVWAGAGIVGAGENDNGLMGVVLDPNFNTNRYAYFWYVPPIANANLNRRIQLARITMTAQNTLDMSTKKILIDILGSKSDQYHSGGPMMFDSYGDLWIAVGNNSKDVNGSGSQVSTTDSSSSAEWGPSDTHSLRGGILRIHPDNSAKGYSIPAGNFGEYWANQFQNQGNAILATQYRDTSKVAPEVYVKGERSNFSIGVHPTKRWVTWGVVNYQTTFDEINLVAKPSFTGFPYFHHNNLAIPGSVGYNINTPMNNSPLNSGVKQLPPAVPGAINWASGDAFMANVAIGGPIYSYNRNLKNKDKLPPHLNNHSFHMGFMSNVLWANTIDSNTVKITRTTRVDNGVMRVTLRAPLGGKIGPDGALYLLNYDGYYNTRNPSVVRMGYVGNCILEPVAINKQHRPGSDFGVLKTLDGLNVDAPGSHEFKLFDLNGNLRVRQSALDRTTYSFAKIRSELKLNSGVYWVSVKTVYGLYRGKVSLE